MPFFPPERRAQLEGWTGLGDKLARLNEPVVRRSLCCWTDLLGFRAPLAAAAWEPSIATWEATAQRLSNAHLQCYQNISGPWEFILTLNDGIVRVADTDRLRNLGSTGYWLRACVMTHLAIGELEKQSQLPGARTVLTAGPRIDYHMTAVTMDDLVMKYTKVTPDGPSRLPAAIAQLTLALNPAPLQMNLAFSKAYLLDSIGSRQGLSGPHFYLDESVLREARSLAAAEGCTDGIIDECENGVRLFAVRASETRYYFGFELTDGAIHVDDPRLKTTVWRVRSFFPCDEDFDEFKFEFPLVGS